MSDVVENINFEPVENEESQDEVIYLETDDIPEENDGEEVLDNDELAKLREQNAELARKADIAESIHSALVDMGGNRGVQPPINATPAKTEAEMLEELQEGMITDPVGTVKRIAETATAGKYNQLVQFAYKQAQSNAKNDPIYKKYGKEVDTFIKGLPIEHQRNPEVFEYAIKEIKGRHFEDIVADKAKELVQSELSKFKGATGGPHAPSNRSTTPPGGVGLTVPRTPVKKIAITPSEKAALEQQSLVTGIPYRVLLDDLVASKRAGGGR